MAGYVTPGLPKRTLDFTGLTVGTTGEVILADRIDLKSWRMRTLMLRVFSHTLSGGFGTISIVALAQSVSAHDPGTDFIERVNPPTIVLGSATPNTAYFQLDMPSPMVRLVAQGARAFAGGGLLSAVVAVEFSVKDA